MPRKKTWKIQLARKMKYNPELAVKYMKLVAERKKKEAERAIKLEAERRKKEAYRAIKIEAQRRKKRKKDMKEAKRRKKLEEMRAREDADSGDDGSSTNSDSIPLAALKAREAPRGKPGARLRRPRVNRKLKQAMTDNIDMANKKQANDKFEGIQIISEGFIPKMVATNVAKSGGINENGCITSGLECGLMEIEPQLIEIEPTEYSDENGDFENTEIISETPNHDMVATEDWSITNCGERKKNGWIASRSECGLIEIEPSEYVDENEFENAEIVPESCNPEMVLTVEDTIIPKSGQKEENRPQSCGLESGLIEIGPELTEMESAEAETLETSDQEGRSVFSDVDERVEMVSRSNAEENENTTWNGAVEEVHEDPSNQESVCFASSTQLTTGVQDHYQNMSEIMTVQTDSDCPNSDDVTTEDLQIEGIFKVGPVTRDKPDEDGALIEQSNTSVQHLNTQKYISSVIRSDMYLMYMCNRCSYKSDDISRVLEHGKIKHRLKPFWCMICQKSYSSLADLTQHANRHTGLSGFPCIFCDQLFSLEIDLKEHLDNHVPPACPADEPLPKEQAERQNPLPNRSTEETKLGKLKFTCKICNETFKTLFGMDEHNERHVSNTVSKYVCPVCSRSFPVKYRRNMHLKLLHMGEAKYKCSYCNKKFMIKGRMKEHIRSHTGERPYKCGWCGRAFRYTHHRADHVRAVHTGQRPYWCKVCQSRFISFGALRKHRIKSGCVVETPQVQKHSGRLFKCCPCNLIFNTYHSLISHQNKKRCIQKAYFSGTVWDKIMKKQDDSSKPYVCPLCGKGFGHKQHMRDHIRVHSGEKPFVCGTCAQCFTQSQCLTTHLQALHRENDHLLNECIHCCQKFDSLRELDKHMETCQDPLQKYQCHYCNKRFWVQEDLVQHQKLHKNVEGSFELAPAEHWQNIGKSNVKQIIAEKIRAKHEPKFVCSVVYEKESAGKEDTAVEVESVKKGQEMSFYTKYKCSTCDRVCISQGQLDKHMAVHLRKHVCKTCKQEFRYPSQLNNHIRQHHEQKHTYRCSLCDIYFGEASELAVHMKIHVQAKLYKCSLCCETFGQAADYAKHVMSHTRNEEEHDQESNSEQPAKENPVEPNPLNFVRSFVEQHEKELGGKEDATVHVESVKRGQEMSFYMKYKCTFCDKMCISQGQLDKHMTVHVRKYVCETCKEEFRSHSQLYIHIQQHHEPEKETYRCSLCDIHFDKASELAVHMKIHVQAKLYKCSLCCETFGQSADYAKHMMAHTGKEEGHHQESSPEHPVRKGYVCPYCLEQFPWKADLLKHMELHVDWQEDSKKMYYCPQCDEAFQYPTPLITHMQIHQQAYFSH